MKFDSYEAAAIDIDYLELNVDFRTLYEATDLFSREEQSYIQEHLQNSQDSKGEREFNGLVNWDYWVNQDIAPVEAAYLLYSVRPDYLTPEMKEEKELPIDISKIARELNHVRKIAGKPSTWRLAELVDEFGERNLNVRMVDAVKSASQSLKAPPVVDNRLKSEKQHDAILAVINQIGLDHMKIPVGKKGTIETICCAEYPDIFDCNTSFDNAWKKGCGRKFSMVNHVASGKRNNK